MSETQNFEYFLHKYPCKKVVIVSGETFMPEGIENYMENMYHTNPMPESKIAKMDLRKKVVYLYPTPGDYTKKVFFVCITD